MNIIICFSMHDTNEALKTIIVLQIKTDCSVDSRPLFISMLSDKYLYLFISNINFDRLVNASR